MAKTLFTATDAAHGTELWVTDGTAGGTSLLKDIYPGSGSSSPSALVNVGGGKQVFAAYDGKYSTGTHGRELWVTDGTASGTTLLKDINPTGNSSSGYSNSDPSGFARLSATQVLFSANDGTHGYELWSTNGTASGTTMVQDIFPGAGSSNPLDITSLGNGEAMFAASEGNSGTGSGSQLWITNGTSAGTSLLANVYPNTAGGNAGPSHITSLGNGKAVFTAISGQNSGGLFVASSSASGATLIVSTGIANLSYINDVTYLSSGKALFRNGSGKGSLWVTDGTAGGSSQIAGGPQSPNDITSLGNGKALLAGYDAAHGTELWVTDGTSAGTSLLDDIYPGTPSPGAPNYRYASSNPANITVLGNGEVLFSANDGTHGTQLWVTDGTSAHTSMVLDINGNSGSSPTDITSLGNGEALFQANNGSTTGLWITDGTSGGTSMLTLGGGASNPMNLSVTLCYAAGTAIRTPDGDVPIEALREGDLVVTAIDGGMVPIVWIGRREVDCARHPNPRNVRPVRVSAHAFGPGLPARDLVLSPDHAVYVNRVLIPVKYLVNGHNVVRLPVERVTYYHLELPGHDIVLAEGLPAESYLDVGDRANFSNHLGVVRLAPDFANRPRNIAAEWETRGCAPLEITGPEVEAARRLLERRVGMLSAAA